MIKHCNSLYLNDTEKLGCENIFIGDHLMKDIILRCIIFMRIRFWGIYGVNRITKHQNLLIFALKTIGTN